MAVPHIRKGTKIITRYVDQDGVLVNETVKQFTYLAGTKEEFMHLYVSFFPAFLGLSAPSKTLYVYFLSNHDSLDVFEVGICSRSFISEKLGICSSAIANALTELKEKGLLFLHSRGMYQLNPRFAFKGSSNARNEALKVIIELGYNPTE